MHAVEDLGLLKMDFLGLKNLTIIEETIKLVKTFKDEEIKISALPLDDKKTFDLLQAGDTTGVFQFESSGMRRYMKELKPSEFEDLIAMVSLYRPGPMELIPEYIARKFKKKPVVYLHPLLKPALENTYGIMIYQEQLMAAARALAGFSLGEADVLRKAVGKKIHSLLLEQKEKLIQGCLKNNVPHNIAEKFWTLIEPFDRYGFNRSHAACYALIGYRTAFLRAHYPVEFSTSLLNSDINDIDRLSFLTGEAKKLNIPVLPPDVNSSMEKFMPEGESIRFGLTAIKNVGKSIAFAIMEERLKNGPYVNFSDFLLRVDHKDLNKKSLESMAKAGALDSFKIERGQILANIDNIIRFAAGNRKSKNNGPSLFGSSFSSSSSIKLDPAPPATSKEKLSWEKELLGFYVSEHPLEQHKEKLAKYSVRKIKDVSTLKNDRLNVRIAGTISQIKRYTTKTGQPMIFAKIADFSEPIEMMVFHDALSRNPEIWKENNVVLAEGRVSWRNDDPKFICNKIVEL